MWHNINNVVEIVTSSGGTVFLVDHPLTVNYIFVFILTSRKKDGAFKVCARFTASEQRYLIPSGKFSSNGNSF